MAAAAAAAMGDTAQGLRSPIVILTIGDLRERLRQVSDTVRPYANISSADVITPEDGRLGFKALSEGLITSSDLIGAILDHTDSNIRRIEVIESQNTQMVDITEMIQSLQSKFTEIDARLEQLRSQCTEDQRKLSDRASTRDHPDAGPRSPRERRQALWHGH